MTQRNTPKEVFLHLLSMATLYMSAVNFLQLVWQAINKWVPDALSNTSYGPAYSTDIVRFALASIIIVFPVYILTMWLLAKGYREDAASREFKLRKWLVYLTLFIAALILIGDLIATLHIFLQGELTTRFILKAFSVLVVAGKIFWYYLWDIRQVERGGQVKNRGKMVAIVTSVVMLAAVVVGFFVMGSPKLERMRRFDNQRVGDLQGLQNQIVYFWQAKHVLPRTLSEMQNNLNGFVEPKDPETGTPYEYSAKGDMSFQLCAAFDAQSDTTASSGMRYPIAYPAVQGVKGSDVWNHGVGRTCFDRTIDPAFFPPINQKPQ